MELKLRNVRQHQQLNIFITEKLWILLDGVILILLKLFGQYYCVILFYGLLYFSLVSKAFHLLEKPCMSQEFLSNVSFEMSHPGFEMTHPWWPSLTWTVIWPFCQKRTVIFPIVILFIFFIRSMTLTGALPGIQYLFKPDINKIFTKKCWQDAATQTFFNLGLGIFQFYDSYYYD